MNRADVQDFKNLSMLEKADKFDQEQMARDVRKTQSFMPHPKVAKLVTEEFDKTP